MNWAIALLAKTSKSVYNDIANVMKLSSPSWVMRKTQDLVGKQGITGHQGINLFSIQTFSEKFGCSASNIVKGSISLDDMYIKQGNHFIFLL